MSKENLNNDYFFPYKIRSCISLEDLGSQEPLFLTEGVIGILQFFYENKVSESCRFITSENVYRLLPLELKKHFYFYRFHLQNSIAPLKKMVVFNYYDSYTSLDRFTSSEFEDSELFFNYIPSSGSSKIHQILNFLKATKGLSFVGEEFFKKNLSYCEYELSIYDDELFSSFSIDYLRYINLGFQLNLPRKLEGSIVSSHWIHPLCRFDLLETLSKKESALDKNNFDKKIFLELDNFNMYHYTKRIAFE